MILHIATTRSTAAEAKTPPAPNGPATSPAGDTSTAPPQPASHGSRPRGGKDPRAGLAELVDGLGVRDEADTIAREVRRTLGRLFGD